MTRIENLVIKNKSFIFTIVSIVVVALIYLNATAWHSILIGLFCLLVYFTINAILCGFVIQLIVPLERYLQSVFGFLFLFYFVCFLGGGFVVFLKFNLLITLFILVAVSLILSIITYFFQKKQINTAQNQSVVVDNAGTETSSHFSRYFLLILPFLMVCALLVLFNSRTESLISSVWQVVNPVYFLLILIISFIVFLLVFSSFSYKKVLLLSVVFSLLIHSYLPIVYKLGYGGDRWRHVGTERQIMSEEVIQPSLLDKPVAFKKIGPVSVPLVFIVGNKTSYANQWAGTVILSYITQLDVLHIDLVVVFILWSVFMPLLFYQLGLFLKAGNRVFALLLSVLSNLFYFLQVYGAITTPFAFGMIFFLLAFVFGVGMLLANKKGKLIALVVLTLIMYLNYILALVLWLTILCMYFFLKLLGKFKISRNIILKIVIITLLAILMVIFISFLDLQYTKVFNLGTQFEGDKITVRTISSVVKNWTYNLSGFSFIRDHSSSNLFFVLQLHGAYPFNSQLLVVGYSALISALFVLVVYTAFKYYRIDHFKNIIIVLVIALSLILFIKNFFINEGPRPLSNRVSIPFCFFLAVVLALGIFKIYNRIANKRMMGYLIAFFLALLLVLNYGINPTLRMVSVGEREAMKYVYDQIKDKGLDAHKCVVAETWPLLALQEVSGNSIVGGGFPMGLNFSQPQGVLIQQKMFKNPTKETMQEALKITGAMSCFFVIEEAWITDYVLEKAESIMGPYKKIKDNYIFNFAE